MKKIISRYRPFFDRTYWYYVNSNNKFTRISAIKALYKIAKECIAENRIDDLTEEFILA